MLHHSRFARPHLTARQGHDGHHEISSHNLTIKKLFTRTPFVLASRVIASGVIAFSTLALPAQAAEKPVGTWGWTTGSATYIRIRPGAQTPAVAKVPNRTQLMVWGTFKGWYRVETPGHRFGWVRHDYMKVPGAAKLKELSRFKAKKASDRTGNQTLYGRPEQLKKYYSRYKAPGARRGLEKQGVRVVAQPAKKKVAKKPTKKPVRVVSQTRPSSKKTKKPVAARPVIATFPRGVILDSPQDANQDGNPYATTGAVPKPKVVQPVYARPVPKARPRKAAKPVIAKVKRPARKPVHAKVVAPMSTSRLPQITATDIMEARQAHIQNSPTSRHKTHPYPNHNSTNRSKPRTQPNSDSTKRGTTPTQPATVQPSSSEESRAQDESTPVVVVVAQADERATKKVAKLKSQSKTSDKAQSNTSKSGKAQAKSYGRGGSPRDVARWAAANGRLAQNEWGEGVAKQALSYRGMPYIRGASNPRRGFDCSGLVYYLMRQRGHNPPRTSSGFGSFGKSVSKSELKPGDIVLFANTYKRGISHVGIYIGNNNFVHAANSGSGVKVDSLSSSYYRKKYYGARRAEQR